MVKRLLLLSLLVLALCGASALVCSAGGPGMAQYVPPPPGPPPLCGPATTSYSVVRESICPVPAQLRKVRVVAPYLAGIAWPRTPLAFGGNPQTFPDPIAPGRYEWLVPVVEIKKEHYWTYRDWCCEKHKVERCVYVKANYVKPKCFGPIPMAPPPPVPCKVRK
jgi:hypothetical protein